MAAGVSHGRDGGLGRATLSGFITRVGHSFPPHAAMCPIISSCDNSRSDHRLVCRRVVNTIARRGIGGHGKKSSVSLGISRVGRGLSEIIRPACTQFGSVTARGVSRSRRGHGGGNCSGVCAPHSLSTRAMGVRHFL